MFLLLGKHVVVRVIMLCFKRQLWYQNRRCSVKLVLGLRRRDSLRDFKKKILFFFFQK